MPINPNDPIVELVDAEDGTFRVKQQSGTELGPFPPERRGQIQKIQQMNTGGMTPTTPLAQADIPPPAQLPQAAPAPLPEPAPAPAPAPAAPTPSTSFAPGLMTAGASDSIQSSATATGLDEGSRVKVEQAGAQQDVAAVEAGQAKTETSEAIAADQDAKIQTAMINTQQELGRKKDQQAAGQQAYDEEMQRYDDAVNRRLDPSQALEGGNLALAFGVGIAQAFANAFTAKGGQKPTLDLVGGIIRRNLDEQRRKRQLQLGDSKDATVRIAKEMQGREDELSELAARQLDLQGRLSSDPIRRAKAKEDAMAVRLQNRERASKRALNTATKVSESLKETQALQAAAPKPVATGTGIPKNELDRILKEHGWDRKEWIALEKEYMPLSRKVQAWDGLEALLKSASEGNDVEGFGRFGKYTPNEWNGPGGVRLRQELTTVMAAYMNKISGAAVSEQERARMTGAMQGKGTLAEMLNGLNILSRDDRGGLTNLEGSGRGDMVGVMSEFQARSASRTAHASSAKQEQIAAREAAVAPPKTEAEKAKADSDKKRIIAQDKRSEARAKKDKPKLDARRTLDALGPPRDGESPKVKRMRAAAKRLIDKAKEQEIQDRFSDDVGGA